MLFKFAILLTILLFFISIERIERFSCTYDKGYGCIICNNPTCIGYCKNLPCGEVAINLPGYMIKN